MSIKRKRYFSLVTIMVLLFVLIQSKDITEVSAVASDQKILDYDMTDVDGAKVLDSQGDFNGTLINPENAELISNSDTGTGVISFQGGNVESFIEIPEGVLEGLESVTVSTLVNWEGSGGAQWLYGLGQSDTHYTYYTPSYVGGANDRVGIATNGWQNESFTGSAKLPATEWKLVTTVVNGPDETLEKYIDGELVSSGSTSGFTLADINNQAGISGIIAKSFYAPDPYFGGMIADFEIYQGALAESDISDLQVEAETKIDSIGGLDGFFTEFAINQLDMKEYLRLNSSVDEISTNLELPTRGAYNTTINWESSHPEIVSGNGVVTRPSSENGNQEVVLTATVSDGADSETKEFTLIVLKKQEDSVSFQEDIDALTVYHLEDVRGNLYLATEGDKGSAISWVSTDETVITTTGEVSRPANGAGDVTVNLTATLQLNDEIATKEFTAIVKESPEAIEDNAAYMMTYFNGEAYADGEQIRFGLSEGNDVTTWAALNDGNPVLSSHLGEEGLRDPSIIRSPEGDKFYLLATDLKVYGTGGDWGRTVREGSNSLMIWESTDLVNWSEQRMVEISSPETGQTWAPEVYYDDATGEYIVYWSSFVYDSVADRYGNGSSHNRIMYAKTRDFYHFTEQETLLDLGHDILDTVAIDYNDKVYRITKGTYYTEKELGGEEIREHVFQDVGDSFFGDFELIKEGIGMNVLDHGEGAEIFPSNTEEGKFYLLIDEYGGGSGYNLFETTDIASADWQLVDDFTLPDRPRHGDVLNLTQEEYQRLQLNIPGVGVDVIEPEEPVDPEEPIEVTGISLDKETLKLTAGEKAQLTATITPDNAPVKDVTWSSSNEDVVTVDNTGNVTAMKAGVATITVSTVSGSFTATSEVNIEEIQEEVEPPLDDGEEEPDEENGQDTEDEQDGENDQNGEEGSNGDSDQDVEEDQIEDSSDKSEKDQKELLKDENNEKELPDTATNLFNYLLFGVVLLVLGGVALLVIRRKNKV